MVSKSYEEGLKELLIDEIITSKINLSILTSDLGSVRLISQLSRNMIHLKQRIKWVECNKMGQLGSIYKEFLIALGLNPISKLNF